MRADCERLARTLKIHLFELSAKFGGFRTTAPVPAAAPTLGRRPKPITISYVAFNTLTSGFAGCGHGTLERARGRQSKKIDASFLVTESGGVLAKP
jgi:hypothetical protein